MNKKKEKIASRGIEPLSLLDARLMNNMGAGAPQSECIGL